MTSIPDPRTGALTHVVGARQDRPNLPTSACPFCIGGLEAPDPYSVRWFENRWPSLGEQNNEVVLFSPNHETSLSALEIGEIVEVLRLIAERYQHHRERSGAAYFLAFENRGRDAGATIDHPHGQIYVFDHVPPLPLRELTVGWRPSKKTSNNELIVTSNSDFRCEVPNSARYPYELLIAPNAPVADLGELNGDGLTNLAEMLKKSLGAIESLFGQASPYMWWMHQRPIDGGRWSTAELHIEITPLWRARGVQRYVAGAELGSGEYFNPVDPLHAAHELREALRSGE